MTCFLIPIASSQIFYGDLFVCVPHFDNNNKLRQLATDLIKCVKDHYVPALALIHEHFFEDLVTRNKKQKIEKVDLSIPYKLTLGEKSNVEMPDYKSPICRSIGDETVKNCYDCQYFGWEESSDNVVEKYLHKLWQDRRTERTDIKESLIFKKRLYTDPNMLDRLEDFFKPSKAKLKKDGDLLPSVLVVAPPGAGKDDVPNLLKLFTNCYNRGEIYKLNMASLKPDVITPVAMVGGKFTWEESNGKFHREETTKLKGILSEIREKTRKEFEDFYRDAGDEGLIKKSELYKNNLGKIIKKLQRNKKNYGINLLMQKKMQKGCAVS